MAKMLKDYFPIIQTRKEVLGEIGCLAFVSGI
ncbi:Uncharacterised protein [[Eubacterium] contortum]|uniref:Uncharacterized protein n=1 Tax=Faecalicatena contorta TaxID=39482 RepID=A0A174IXB2_9FIRM|nr:Uncharacterised protein [[Eubacterium] contortum] [Faecalicatena contorta]